MGAKEIDLTGKKFNKLTAIKYTNNEQWLFVCECGKQVVIDRDWETFYLLNQFLLLP